MRVLQEPMAVSRVLGGAVLCHGSHQKSVQALLAGKPRLTAPTQLAQFPIARCEDALCQPAGAGARA